MAKRYTELPVEEWNTRHFTEYMKDLHEEVFGVAYQPGKGWAAESGLIGDAIGTQKKPAQYPKALIKEFIERSMRTHKPKPGYRGISFMYMWSFRKYILQELEYEYKQRAKEEAEADLDINEMEEWF